MFGLTPWKKERNGLQSQRGDFPLDRVRDEFNSLFDRFFGQMTTPFGDWGGQAGWGLDVDDTGNELLVRADAPGFEPEDFDIQLSGNVLTLRAERKQETGEKGKDYSFSQRRLQRTVTLPAGADADKVEAHYRNGVLELRLPKKPEAQAKRIEVKQ